MHRRITVLIRLASLALWLCLTGGAGIPAAQAQAVVGTVRYVEIVDGNVLGGWRTWQEASDISDIRRVVTVVKAGRVYDPAAIYRALGIEPCCERTTRRPD